jgi:hypothetical protein
VRRTKKPCQGGVCGERLGSSIVSNSATQQLGAFCICKLINFAVAQVYQNIMPAEMVL